MPSLHQQHHLLNRQRHQRQKHSQEAATAGALKIDTTSKPQDLSIPISPTLSTLIHPPIPPSDGDYNSTGTTKSRSCSRHRRPRRRLNSSTESTKALPFLKEINNTIPSDSSSSTFELPYHPALQRFCSGKGPHDTTTNSNINTKPSHNQSQHPHQTQSNASRIPNSPTGRTSH